jgi:glutamate formiminotransferase
MIECIPNVSEGCRRAVVDRLASAIALAGGRVLDASSDSVHNRSVLTFIADSTHIAPAVVALFEQAIPEIDLRAHRGAHPRMGAIDVVPLVPLMATRMDECIALARTIACTIAERFALPVYLYEEAATRPERRRLEAIRRGGFEALAERMQRPEWAPDFGPVRPHPTAGATAIGARGPLIAFNVNLATTRLDIANAVASRVRESNGGLPSVKAIGIPLGEHGWVQVSMNLTNYEVTPIEQAFDAVAHEAREFGVDVVESEIVGLIPRAALAGTTPDHLRLKNYSDRLVLEHHLEQY